MVTVTEVESEKGKDDCIIQGESNKLKETSRDTG